MTTIKKVQYVIDPNLATVDIALTKYSVLYRTCKISEAQIR